MKSYFSRGSLPATIAFHFGYLFNILIIAFPNKSYPFDEFNFPVIEFAYQGPQLKYFGDKINISITGDVKFVLKKSKDVIDGTCYKSFTSTIV